MKPQNRTTLGCASRANASRRLHATVHGHDASVFQKRLLKENYNVLSEAETCCGSEEGLVRYLPRSGGASNVDSSVCSGSVKPSRPPSEESFYDAIESHEFERVGSAATVDARDATSDVVEDVYSPYAYNRKTPLPNEMQTPAAASLPYRVLSPEMQWKNRSYAPASGPFVVASVHDETTDPDSYRFSPEGRAYAPALQSPRTESKTPPSRALAPSASPGGTPQNRSRMQSAAPTNLREEFARRALRPAAETGPPLLASDLSPAAPAILHRYASMPALCAADEERVEEFRRSHYVAWSVERRPVSNEQTSAVSSPRCVGEVCSVEFTGDPVPTFYSWGRVVLKKPPNRPFDEPRLEAEDVQELIDRFGPQSWWSCLWAPWNCWGLWKA